MRSMCTLRASAFLFIACIAGATSVTAQMAPKPAGAPGAPRETRNEKPMSTPEFPVSAPASKPVTVDNGPRLSGTPATTEAAGRKVEDGTTANRPATAPAAPVPVTAASTRQSKALMIVGGVGLLVGAAIGGDGGNIIMIGSGVIGLYGLYQYLR